DFLVEQRAQARAEAAAVDHLDIFQRQNLLQAERDIEVAAGAHADGHRHILEVLGPADPRLGTHEDRPRRDAVAVGHEAAHARARVGDASPDARALDQVLVALGVGLVLGTLLVVEALPARLRAAEGLDVELDLDTLGFEEAFLLRYEIVEAHALGGDADFSHGCSC